MAAEFGRIIVPTDGSHEAKMAAKKALFLAKNIGAEVVALFVIDTSFLNRFPSPQDLMSVNWDDVFQTEGLTALDYVEKMGKKLDVKVIRKMIEGVPDEEIIKISRKNDLIVMGSKGMTAIDRILIGSVSEKVLHHAHCPVMIVREPKEKK